VRPVALGALFFACAAAPHAEGGGDAGTDAGPPGPTEPAAPEPASPPLGSPCPPGWREVADPSEPDLAVCDPWPAEGVRDCAEDEAQFPGGSGCEPIGSDCPEGVFADAAGLPADAIYVLAGAPPGGDGTFDAPFSSLRDALAAAPNDATIALSMGTFDESLVIRRPVTIVGACVGSTVIASSDPDDFGGTLTVSGTAVTLRDLQVSGERRGVRVIGGDVTFASVLVRGARVVGIDVQSGGTVQGSRLVVRDTRLDGAGLFGNGLSAVGAGRIDLRTAAFERNASGSVLLANETTLFHAEDLSVRATRTTGAGTFGRGLEVRLGARAELVRTVLAGNDGSALYASAAGTSVDAEDLVIADPGQRSRDEGLAIEVEDAASVAVRGGVFDRALGIAVFAGAGSFVRTEDVVVRDVRPGPDQFGDAFHLSGGAQGELERVAVLRAGATAVVAQEAQTTLSLVDVIVRDTQSSLELDFGYGLELASGAVADLTRVSLERNRTAAVLLAGVGTALRGTDLRVAETRSREADGEIGLALQATEGAEVRLARVALVDDRQDGVAAYDAGTLVALEDTLVERILPADCGEACPGSTGGRGLAAIDSASISATRFRIAATALCGVQLASGGVVDLSDGVVEGCPVGVNVQTEDFDLDRVRDGVAYRDNGADLDSSALPLPEAIRSL
jgi:hypothetical protein